jgi:hypothetical protein
MLQCFCGSACSWVGMCCAMWSQCIPCNVGSFAMTSLLATVIGCHVCWLSLATWNNESNTLPDPYIMLTDPSYTLMMSMHAISQKQLSLPSPPFPLTPANQHLSFQSLPDHTVADARAPAPPGPSAAQARVARLAWQTQCHRESDMPQPLYCCCAPESFWLSKRVGPFSKYRQVMPAV